MLSLPIDSHLPQIMEAARAHRALVLVAEPGAGKTTRVAPALLAAGVLPPDHPNLVLLQPRRIAARAAASRIADEQGWSLGREVGHHIRFDRKLTAATRLRVLTEGILTRQLLDDPFLENVGAVLLDEFHERSLHSDLALALLREVKQTVRPDLVVVVMSATLDAEPVATFLGDCPVVRVPGRTFPVQIDRVDSPLGRWREELPGAVAAALERIDNAGDVLVFLPGAEEIRRTAERIAPVADRQGWLVLPLHGSRSPEEQNAALRPADRRKIILATNVAETSLTIDGVRTVIDGGLARVASFDPQRGLDRLELKRISLASATQRSGRAGRTAGGACLRLWTAAQERTMEPFELPEIRRVDLCSTVLALHAWGKPEVRCFGWFEPPSEPALAAAETLLNMLGALDEQGNITPLGRRLLALPLHPRLARLMVQAADWGMVREGATLAALMEEKDIMRRGEATPMAGASDLLQRFELLEGDDRSLDSGAVWQVRRARDALLRIAGPGRSDPPPDRETAMQQLILLAYPDRVARRRVPGGGAATMVGGGGVRLVAESVVRDADVFVALNPREDQRSNSREALVSIASAIDADWLEKFFPQSIRKERIAVFDEKRQRVVGRGRIFYRDLLLREDQDAAVDAETAGAVLAAALRPRALELFEGDESAAEWLARLRFLRANMPGHPWPSADAQTLGDLLADVCRGKRSVADVNGILANALRSILAYPLDRLFEEAAPPTLTVPSGSRIPLDYRSGARPVLAVRLQEIFGWTETPRVAGGRVPVLLHLLGPNFRPVQVTDDLKSFWVSAYFQVRKDLRTRYPKHAWPEDPLAAHPEARGRHRAKK